MAIAFPPGWIYKSEAQAELLSFILGWPCVGEGSDHELQPQQVLEILQGFVRQGADPRRRAGDISGGVRTALEHACCLGHLPIVKALLAMGDDMGCGYPEDENTHNGRVLATAALLNDHPGVLLHLFELKVPALVKPGVPLSQCYSQALLDCLNHAAHRCAEAMLRLGADPNTQDDNRSCVHYAYDSVPLLEMLHRCGADFEVQDSLGDRAVFYAQNYLNVESLCYLLSIGVDVHSPNRYGQTLLQCAQALAGTLSQGGAPNARAQQVVDVIRSHLAAREARGVLEEIQRELGARAMPGAPT